MENIGFSKYFALGAITGREPFVSGIRAATLFAGVHAGNRWDSRQSIKKMRHSPQKHTHIHPTPELAVYFLELQPGNTNQKGTGRGCDHYVVAENVMFNEFQVLNVLLEIKLK